MRLILVIAAALFAGACPGCKNVPEEQTETKIEHTEADITLGTLLKEVTDRDALAEFPSPCYTEASFSSYDRASVSKDYDWFANIDKNQFVRIERVDGRIEYVLFDADGPGAITRWWMTFDGAQGGLGIMRIYIDDDPSPAITSTPFQLLSGRRIGPDPLASSVSEQTEYERRGHNLYFPIPYAKHCKVTYTSNYLSPDGDHRATGSETVYYNIEYRTYEPGTNVASYSSDEKTYYKDIAEQVAAELRNHNNPDGNSTDISCSLEPGQSASFDFSGPAAIRYMSMKLEAADIQQALRSTLLEISFDSEQTVWIPVGEFFGIGYKQIYSQTWNTSTSTDGKMEARWTMPFASSATIKFTNLGSQKVTLRNAEAKTSDYDFGASSMHFHAGWRLYHHLNTHTSPYTGAAGGPYDLHFADLEGKGVYVGDVMTLYNTSSGWWGEGDEKIYTDGATFPQIFGTGTEDYYGYAWGRPAEIVGHPFLSQPSGRGNASPGYTVNARFRALDAIPFSRSLVVDMEMLHWYDVMMELGVSTFFYMIPGGKSIEEHNNDWLKVKVALSNIDFLDTLREDKMEIEAEYLTMDSCSGGVFAIQTDYGEYWSNGAQIFWNHIPVGSELTVSFDSPYAGTYSLDILYAYSWDYGKFDFWFNGTKLDTARSFKNNTIKTVTTNYGQVNVVKGRNTFRFKAVGTAAGYDQAYFGLDKITFRK